MKNTTKMSNTNFNFCRICLKIDITINLFNISFANDIFSRLFELTVDTKEIEICMWCKVALTKADGFLKMVEESQTILSSCNNVYSSIKSTKLKHSLHSFVYHHNDHEDIPPIEVEQTIIFTEDIEIENPIELQENTDFNNIETNYEQEIDTPTKKNDKKPIDFQEMKFEVVYLNIEEQLQEIESKKLSEKYKNMKFHCKKCGIGFLTNDVFEDHKKRHELTTNFKCPTCEIYLKSKEVLSQHLLAHRRRFVCQVCGDTFKRWRHCVNHRYKCDGVESCVVCGECRKVFSNAISLDAHIRGVHKKERKYICDQCKRGFATKQRLTVHSRSHSNTRPFACALCPRTFTTNSNLRAHTTVHTQRTAQHYCVECHVHYKTERGLKRHCREAKRHRGDNEFKFSCPDCPKCFLTEHLLKSHIHSRHLTNYTCSHCEKNFSNNSNLKKHYRCVHPEEEKLAKYESGSLTEGSVPLC